MSDTSPISPIPTTPTRRLRGGVKSPSTSNRGQGPGVIRSADQLDLSADAVQLSRRREAPAVRSDLVERVRSEIDSGAYDTPAKLDQAVQAMVHELTQRNA